MPRSDDAAGTHDVSFLFGTCSVTHAVIRRSTDCDVDETLCPADPDRSVHADMGKPQQMSYLVDVGFLLRTVGLRHRGDIAVIVETRMRPKERNRTVQLYALLLAQFANELAVGDA